MTSAELKTLREALGLPVTWVAERTNVQRRTVEYWESGRISVPQYVAALLIDLDKHFDVAAEQALSVSEAACKEHGQPESIDLKRYRTDEALWAARPDMLGLPVTAHAALLDRCRRVLVSAGFSVTLQYADN